MNPAAQELSTDRPVGVFDSGLGGLTVVREILRERPGEKIVYVGDTAHVPYGPRSCAEVRDFSLAIGRYLARQARCRAIVVACNTATAAGVDALRVAFPDLPIVGMEPGVKPAAAQTKTGRIAVLATVSTLSADRFTGLVERFGRDITVVTQPCSGWVECVERGDLDSPETRALVARYVAPLVASGVDTLVLGCTHYPLLRPLIEAIAGPGIGIVDTGPAVARHAMHLVPPPEGDSSGSLLCLTTSFHAPTIPTARRILAGIPSSLEVQFGSLTWKNGELTDDADTASGRTQRA